MTLETNMRDCFTRAKKPKLRHMLTTNELDGAMEVGFGVCDLLGERQRIAGFDEYVQPPRLDFLPLRLGLFRYLCHVRACSPPRRRTLPGKVWLPKRRTLQMRC